MISPESGDFMKTRKQIFRNFQYLECDAFAEYLEGMAAKGWRFTGWKLGMIFEKEEPRKRVYAVEVFLHSVSSQTLFLV